MGKVTGFLEIDRHERTYKSASDRIRSYKEFTIPLSEARYSRSGCPMHGLWCTLLPRF